MADTCSFFNGIENYKNYQCFAPLIAQRDNQYIIIEKEKLIDFDKEVVKNYLNDLCELFNVSYDYNKEKYQIHVSNIKGLGKRIVFFMIIRFLWENNIDNNTDRFINVVKHYFNLKKLYNDKYNNIQYICIACNCYMAEKKYYNSNHFLANPTSSSNGITKYKSCKIIDNINKLDNITHVNSFFTSNESIVFIKKDPEKFTNDDYESIINFLKL